MQKSEAICFFSLFWNRVRIQMLPQGLDMLLLHRRITCQAHKHGWTKLQILLKELKTRTKLLHFSLHTSSIEFEIEKSHSIKRFHWASSGRVHSESIESGPRWLGHVTVQLPRRLSTGIGDYNFHHSVCTIMFSHALSISASYGNTWQVDKEFSVNSFKSEKICHILGRGDWDVGWQTE